MDVACECQISSHRAAIIQALIIAEEIPTSWDTKEAMLRISWPSDDSHADEVPEGVVRSLFLSLRFRYYYLQFLDHPKRCGVLYHERATHYTRIINSWLLFLEAPPKPLALHRRLHKKCRKIVLTHWSRLLSKCVPGNKDLICRLRNFDLAKARKRDVERVIAWLEVSVRGYPS